MTQHSSCSVKCIHSHKSGMFSVVHGYACVRSFVLALVGRAAGSSKHASLGCQQQQLTGAAPKLIDKYTDSVCACSVVPCTTHPSLPHLHSQKTPLSSEPASTALQPSSALLASCPRWPPSPRPSAAPHCPLVAPPSWLLLLPLQQLPTAPQDCTCQACWAPWHPCVLRPSAR
jgi:hypothetical protein